MIPTYNPTPLSLQFPDDDSAKTIFIAVRGSALGKRSGSGGGEGVENNSRHVWFFWHNHPVKKPIGLELRSSSAALPFLTISSPSTARQVLQLERHQSSYVYLEPNVVLPLVSSFYPFATEIAYQSASYYTPVYTGWECEMVLDGVEDESPPCHTGSDESSRTDSDADGHGQFVNPKTTGGFDNEDGVRLSEGLDQVHSDQIFPLGHFSRDERELILSLAADIDINQYLHGKGDQYGRANSWSASGVSKSISNGGVSGTNTEWSDDAFATSSDSQTWKDSWYFANATNKDCNGSNGSGMVNGSRVWARELLGKMVEEGLMERDMFLRIVNMVPLPR